jgi:hypothetical protein
MGVDVDKSGVDIRDPVRIMGGLGLAQQGIAFEIRPKNDLDQAFRPVRSLLGKAADSPPRRNRDRPGLGRQFSPDGAEQGGFTDAVAANEADARARHDLGRAMVDQKPSGDPDR